MKSESLMFCPPPPPSSSLVPAAPPPLPPPASSSVHITPSGPGLGVVLLLLFVPIHIFYKGLFFLTFLGLFNFCYLLIYFVHRLRFILGFSPLGAILVDPHHLLVFFLNSEPISPV